MIREYLPYGLIVGGVFLIFLGFKFLFKPGYVEMLMDKGFLWKNKRGDTFSDKDALQYNKYGKGIEFILTGIVFMILGIVFLK